MFNFSLFIDISVHISKILNKKWDIRKNVTWNSIALKLGWKHEIIWERYCYKWPKCEILDKKFQFLFMYCLIQLKKTMFMITFIVYKEIWNVFVTVLQRFHNIFKFRTTKTVVCCSFLFIHFSFRSILLPYIQGHSHSNFFHAQWLSDKST